MLRVHWRLVQAPAPALEYVVAHEVAHLVHRNHSPEFWGTFGRHAGCPGADVVALKESLVGE